MGQRIAGQSERWQDSTAHARAIGTRIEETARLADAVESAIREIIATDQVETILDNLGVPNSGSFWTTLNSGSSVALLVIGSANRLNEINAAHTEAPNFRFLRTCKACRGWDSILKCRAHDGCVHALCNCTSTGFQLIALPATGAPDASTN
jgi:hypothetical protein